MLMDGAACATVVSTANADAIASRRERSRMKGICAPEELPVREPLAFPAQRRCRRSERGATTGTSVPGASDGFLRVECPPLTFVKSVPFTDPQPSLKHSRHGAMRNGSRTRGMSTESAPADGIERASASGLRIVPGGRNFRSSQYRAERVLMQFAAPHGGATAKTG